MLNRILRIILLMFKNKKIVKNKKRSDNSPPDDIYPLW